MATNRTIVIAVFQTLFVVGASAQTPDHFRKDVDRYVESLNLPTLAVGVAKGDSLIFFAGTGKSGVPITPDHIFGIASLTKSFTSVVMQQLEAEGKLSLNDPVNKFPNKYFTKERWTNNTTLAQILSHTSESRPEGSSFVYNGGKYNVVFNAFAAINPPVEGESMTRPFTKEVEARILQPLHMKHTLVQYVEKEHAELKDFAVPAFRFDKSRKAFDQQPVNLAGIESGPGYGMMSSIADLVKYSAALDKGTLVSKKQYDKITSPFYKGSPYGLGWFTTNFEGLNLHWAYGYGSTDAAILLKIPSKNLTFVLVSSCDLPSATTRLGYGNPLNSPLVCSFIRNFISSQPDIISMPGELLSAGNEVAAKIKPGRSRIYIEELFATATVLLFNPSSDSVEKAEGLGLLKLLVKYFPKDEIWKSPTAFDLIAAQGDDNLLSFASKLSENLLRSPKGLHPATTFHGGVILEKLKDSTGAIRFFNLLAQDGVFNEQGYKLNALMKLGRYYQRSDPALAKKYLQMLVKCKEYINAQDDQYKEAKAMVLAL